MTFVQGLERSERISHMNICDLEKASVPSRGLSRGHFVMLPEPQFVNVS